jgi:hypothetical protein
MLEFENLFFRNKISSNHLCINDNDFIYQNYYDSVLLLL